MEVHQLVRDLSGNILVDQIIHHTYTIRNGLIEQWTSTPELAAV